MLWIGIHDVPLAQPLTVLLRAFPLRHIDVCADNFDKPSERGEVASETERGFDELTNLKPRLSRRIYAGGRRGRARGSRTVAQVLLSSLAPASVDWLLTVFMGAQTVLRSRKPRCTPVKRR